MTANLHMGMNMDFDLYDTKSSIAMSGSLCLPVYPPRATINAEKLQNAMAREEASALIPAFA